MRYYGAKTKLLPFIEQTIKTTGINGTSTFVDMFAGTNVVGKHFKKLGYTVISNDNLEFSYALAKTYIETNKEPKFLKLKAKLKLYDDNISFFNYLNNLNANVKGFIYENYSPNGGRQYFSDSNAIKIDTFRYLFEEWKQTKLINEQEFYYLITALLKAVNLVSNVSGTYAAFLKTWDKRALNPIQLKPIEIIQSRNKNKAYKKNANDLIKEIRPDILYLDPPYNNRQYASNYFILELIAEGWFKEKPEIYGETGMRKYDHQKSKYCSKVNALDSLEDLISNSIKSQYILLSYNNEGVIAQHDLYKMLSKFGRVEVFTETHKRYKSINQKIDDPDTTKENLYLLKPKNVKNYANNLSGKEWLQNSFSIWRDLGKNEEEKKLKHPAIFTIKLVTKLIDTFCKPDGGVILDCFAGTGTTLISGLLRQKDVVGIDLVADYKKLFTKRVQNNYGDKVKIGNADYIVGDARRISEKLDSNSIDLCITSPPYWDILNRQRTADLKQNVSYSSDRCDLGNIEDYELFINSLQDVFKEVFKVLKNDAYFIVNVMDLRKKDRFFPLHIDTIKISKDIGFSLEDIIIWDRQQDYNNMRPLGYPFKFIVNKVHEYILIFRK